MKRFDYDVAFGRNRGLVSAAEQERLRQARVLLIGVGGVGGVHATTLARLGVGHFRLVDPDTFSLANFNRQAGATMQTLGFAKASTMAAQVLSINPDAEVEAFDVALNQDNVVTMLEGVDLVVDGIDFFSLAARTIAYEAAYTRGIPVVSSGPIGMSATMHIFAPGGMSFSRYYDLTPNLTRVQQLAAFLVGVTPRMSQRGYVDMGYVSLSGEHGPSLGASCMLCAGVVGVESLRLLLGRPGVCLAPHYYQFDAYYQQMYRGYLRWGNRHPLQRIKRWRVERMLVLQKLEQRSEQG
ncbi:MAG: ThiF family adenylyltransferase [Deltaproteobacteria bacterium]|nr:ThiF family adenylyltransferase [Deltaproteobacteria bacterium]